MATHSPKDVHAFDQAAAMRLQLTLGCVSCSLCDAFRHIFPSSAPSFSSGNVVTGSRGHAPFPIWLKTHPECFQSPSSLCRGAPGTVWLVSGQVICPKAELVKHRSSDWDNGEGVFYPIRWRRTCPGVGGGGRKLKPLIKPCFLFLSFFPLPPSSQYFPNLTKSTIFLPSVFVPSAPLLFLVF